MRARPRPSWGWALTVAAIACIGLAFALPELAAAALPDASNGRIAFVSDRDPLGSGNSQVFVMGSQGENPTNLSTDSTDEEGPSFSPDGSRIAFVGNPDFAEDKFPSEEIYVMNADGTGRERLTSTAIDEFEPVFSPDGSKIAFVSFTDGSGGDVLELMNADGSGRARLLAASGSEQIGYSDPTWSPDGSRIAYTRSSVDGADIWVLDVGSGVQTQLTTGSSLEREPDFSPDGSKIAYVSDPYVFTTKRLFSNPDIWVMNADGSDKTQLTHDPAADEETAWSPDGSMIAFSRRQAETDLHAFEFFPGDIHVMNADGSNDHVLLGGPYSDESPSWQPVGQGADDTPPSFTGDVEIPRLLVIGPQPTREPTPPVVSATASRSRGTAIRFRLSERASVKLAVERMQTGRKVKRGRRTVCLPAKRAVAAAKRCTARKLAGWMVPHGKRGRNRVSFSGRLGRRPLKPGRYRIQAGAVDRHANPARQKRSRRFRVVR